LEDGRRVPVFSSIHLLSRWSYPACFTQCIVPTSSQEERIPLASEDEEDDEEIESSDSEDGAPEDERLQELRQRLATKVNIEDIYTGRIPSYFKKLNNMELKINDNYFLEDFIYLKLISNPVFKFQPLIYIFKPF
jgi:hypothetical protein